MPPEPIIPPARRRRAVLALFVGAALLALPFADLALAGGDPWGALGRMALGLLHPDFAAVDAIGRALALTLAFALIGVAAGAGAGFILALFYHHPAVRLLAVTLRSVHELFWALLVMQSAGLGITTGVLAIALPYSGIFARVFADYLDAADDRPRLVLPPACGRVSGFFYARLPLVWGEMRTYTLYRLECGIRASTVLGFIGLPTLGFQLDSVFRQGAYGAAGAILLVYVLVAGSVRHWLRPRLLPLYLGLAVLALAQVETPPVQGGMFWCFLTHDIVPAPLRGADLTAAAPWAEFAGWLEALLRDQALPGLAATWVLAQLALVLTGGLAIIGFPVIVRRLVGGWGSWIGHGLLVVARSCPEYMLAYVAMQCLGPSMLPAILALAVHNGAIIAHLLGRQAGALCRNLRPDAPGGLDLYGYELVPRLFVSFLSLCLYRWEIIMRESAILGMLGVATLGFHIDAAVAELRMDRVMLFLLVTVLATLAIDRLSGWLRRWLGMAGLQIGGPADKPGC